MIYWDFFVYFDSQSKNVNCQKECVKKIDGFKNSELVVTSWHLEKDDRNQKMPAYF